jgi:LemA protein
MATYGIAERPDKLPRAHGPQLVFLGLTLLFVFSLAATAFAVSRYNGLVERDRAVQEQWGRVEDADQLRADLIPDMIALLRRVPNFSSAAINDAVRARARLEPGPATAPSDATTLAEYQRQRAALGEAITQLLALTANEAATARTAPLLTQRRALADAQARSAAEREQYDALARRFNASRQGVGNALVASLFGSRFAKKATFSGQ